MRRSKNCLSIAAAVTLLLLGLTAMEGEAIRLDVQTRASVVRSNQMATDKPGSDDVVVVKGSTSSVVVGEAKRSAAAAAVVAAEKVRAVAHKLPEFHEDYYGPSDHSPRHH